METKTKTKTKKPPGAGCIRGCLAASPHVVAVTEAE
jgi:hypothetical protein